VRCYHITLCFIQQYLPAQECWLRRRTRPAVRDYLLRVRGPQPHTPSVLPSNFASITQLRVTEAYKRQGVARVLINRNGEGESAKQKRAHKAAAELQYGRWNALEAARRHSEPDGKIFRTSTGIEIFVPTSATHLQSDDLDWDWAYGKRHMSLRPTHHHLSASRRPVSRPLHIMSYSVVESLPPRYH
jgi:hypothetical protein